MTVFGDRDFKEEIEIKGGHMIGPQSNNWCYSKERRLGHDHTQRENDVKTKGEDGRRHARERGLGRNKPSNILISQF